MAGPVVIESTSSSGAVSTTTYMPGTVLAVRLMPAMASSYDVAVLTPAGWETITNVKGANAKEAKDRAHAFVATIVADASDGDAPAAQYAEVRKP